jgi:hypothetical protein
VATPAPGTAWSGDAPKILEYFGLAWDPSNNRWLYDHGASNNILRLSDVPAGREPDFFELLKAAINVGSLGKQSGAPYLKPGNPNNYPFDRIPALKGGFDGSVNYQIIQIAANIIDQADSDNYPTRISFDGREFYGVEDLPRIQKVRERAYVKGIMPNFGPRVNDATAPWANSELRAWMLQPEILNPHAPTPKSSGTGPQRFRIVADSYTPVWGQTVYLWPSAVPQDGPYNLPPAAQRVLPAEGGSVDFSIRPNGPVCYRPITYKGGQGVTPNAAIEFDAPIGGDLFRFKPKALAAPGYPSGSNSMGTPDNADMTVTDLSAPGKPDTVIEITDSNANRYPVPGDSGNRALGFVVGWLPMGPVVNSQNYYMGVRRSWGGPITMELQYKDAAGGWWTFDKFQLAYAATEDAGTSINLNQGYSAHRADPRTDRWAPFLCTSGFGDTPPYGFELTAKSAAASDPLELRFTASSTPTTTPGWSTLANGDPFDGLQRNLDPDEDKPNYTDPDGVRRHGTSAYAGSGAEGWPLIDGNYDSRPVILNRPFRSVAELGHVFRGTPWRNLDVMTPESGDRALLDVFCLEEAPEDNLVAGRVNLNTRHKPVLKALVQGAGLVNGNTIDGDTAEKIAAQLITFTSGTGSGQGPLRDRSEIVGRFVSGTSFTGPAEDMAAQLKTSEQPIERNRDVIIAALADAGTVRTWNVLIDIIAQTGTRTANGDFNVNGESRLWYSVAIDRVTGKILDHSTENVAE